jgi:hypothetical protein
MGTPSQVEWEGICVKFAQGRKVGAIHLRRGTTVYLRRDGWPLRWTLLVPMEPKMVG